MTMTLIQTVTVSGSSTFNVQFANIPLTFTDLLLVASARSSATGTSVDTVGYLINTNSPVFRELYGTGSNSASWSSSGYLSAFQIPSASHTANTFGNGSMYIPNYATAGTKAISIDHVGENNGTQSRSEIRAASVTATAGINQIDITIVAGNYVAGSSFSLYGITRA